MKPKRKIPMTAEERRFYRVHLSCEIGRKALRGDTKLPDGMCRLEYAVYNILHAIEDLVE